MRTSSALSLSLVVAVTLMAATANADPPGAIAFMQPEQAGSPFLVSSWVYPDGSDSDFYSWENFTLPNTTSVTDVTWRGGYTAGAPFGHAYNFSIKFYATNITGFEPLVGIPDINEPLALAQHEVGNNAGESLDGASYAYHFTLPSPFVAQAGVKYWIRIEAYQPIYPDWGVATGRGGNSNHFRFSTGMAMFQNVPGDLCFTLSSTINPGVALTLAAEPPSAGTVTGSGTFLAGTTAYLGAVAAPGYQFTGWDIGGSTVSTSPNYSFAVAGPTLATAKFQLNAAVDDWNIY